MDLGSSVPVSEVFIVNRVGLTSRLVNMEIRVGEIQVLLYWAVEPMGVEMLQDFDTLLL